MLKPLEVHNKITTQEKMPFSKMTTLPTRKINPLSAANPIKMKGPGRKVLETNNKQIPRSEIQQGEHLIE